MVSSVYIQEHTITKGNPALRMVTFYSDSLMIFEEGLGFMHRSTIHKESWAKRKYSEGKCKTVGGLQSPFYGDRFERTDVFYVI